MRFSTAAVFAFFSTSAARGLSFFGDEDQGVIVNDVLDVPGQSPLKFCQEARDDDIIVIERVDLSPNPPLAGQKLTIQATGTVKKAIEEGAYVNLQVKYGYIRLINTKADLCDQIKNVDLSCPISEGVLTIVKDVDLPAEIPPGKYTVMADVFTKEDVHVTCLTAEVVFSAKKSKDSAWLDL